MLFTMLASGLPAGIRSSVLNLALAPLYISGVIGSLASAALIGATGGDLRPIWLGSAGVLAVALIPGARLRAGAGESPDALRRHAGGPGAARPGRQRQPEADADGSRRGPGALPGERGTRRGEGGRGRGLRAR